MGLEDQWNVMESSPLCRAFLARRRGRRKPNVVRQRWGAATVGLKMDWTKRPAGTISGILYANTNRAGSRLSFSLSSARQNGLFPLASRRAATVGQHPEPIGPSRSTGGS
jgi:hypothetical protein